MSNLFKLHSSLIFSVSLTVSFFFTTLIVFALPIQITAKLTIVGLLAGVLTYYLFRDALLLLSTSWIELRLQEEDVVLVTRSGKEISGRIMAGSLVTPVLTVLNIMPDNKMTIKSVIIFIDSMHTEDYRNLRVLLRWSK